MIVNNYSDIYRGDSSLRPYQQKAKKEIFESWDEVDSVMFQMPTGTGKTRLFTSIISDINKYSIQRREAVKILIIAHRTELIDQIDKSLEKYKVPHNVIAGGREKNYKFPVSVASIQTITNKRNLKDAKKLKIQFVIIDEAHHALASSYKKLWDLYPEAKRLGVTATPWRMNHQSFTDLFDKLILSMPVKDFIKQGFLAPYKYFSLKNDSDIQRTIDDIELDKFGEYKESSMEEKMDIGSIRAQLLDSYLSLAEGKKGIIYAINIAHAKHICEEYKSAGYRTVCIDSKTPDGERKDLVSQFKRGLIDIIVNVDIFSEGFDCPDIEFIQLARPTCSLVKYLQQVGRGLRITENKQNCVILDNVGMYAKFGLPDARRHWKYHFLGKPIDETPTVSVVSKGNTGRQRFVDLSEGTEDMELIQDVSEMVETNAVVKSEVSSPAVNDFFPLFGITLGKTTWQQVEDMGYEIKIWKGGPGRYIVINNIMFWDYLGRGIFTSLYWTYDDCDFPLSWKTKGLAWDIPYSDWVDVFKKLGYRVEGGDTPTIERDSKNGILKATLEAYSQDNTLSFDLDFQYDKLGTSNVKVESLSSIFVYYDPLSENHPQESVENNTENKMVSPSNVSKEIEVFDPTPILKANNYQDDNFIFWFKENKKIYEAYIQDDKSYIISELIIDKSHHCVHRKRVGKIPMDSWMFWQMEREKVDNLKSIAHYGANYTIFHYRVIGKDKVTKDKFFDYKGREIDDPSVVKAKCENAKKEGEVKDFIDVPVSKAIFNSKLRNHQITILRTLKGITRPIAMFSVISDFGKHYYYNADLLKRMRKEMGLKRLGDHNSEHFTIYRSDDHSFTVRCIVNEIPYLYNYDLKGKLLKKGTIAESGNAIEQETALETPIVAPLDADKLWHVFDSKASSYKFFWFLSILQLFKESKSSSIEYKTIVARMIANAWRYLFVYKATFPSSDQIPKYIDIIIPMYRLRISSSKDEVEGQILYYYNSAHLNRLLSPLLKNVPYRFLSPWIPFTSNEEVVAKSNEKDAKCLYALHDDHIEINPIWHDYLTENYDKVVQFVEMELRSYLKCK